MTPLAEVTRIVRRKGLVRADFGKQIMSQILMPNNLYTKSVACRKVATRFTAFQNNSMFGSTCGSQTKKRQDPVEICTYHVFGDNSSNAVMNPRLLRHTHRKDVQQTADS